VPLSVLPDVERILVAVLRAAPEIQALAGGDPPRVHTRLPEDPTFPLLRLQRVGGSLPFQRPAWLDAARVQFDSWADTKREARDLAATAEAVLLQTTGSQPPGGALGVITSIEESLGLQWLQEPDSARHRYLFEVRVYAHPPAA
jgi:hypothetical protein